MFYTADALSRAPLGQIDDPFRKELRAYVQMIVAGLPASEQQLENIKEQQDKDPECSQLKELGGNGKLTWDTMRGTLKQYYPVRDELNVVNGIPKNDHSYFTEKVDAVKASFSPSRCN